MWGVLKVRYWIARKPEGLSLDRHRDLDLVRISQFAIAVNTTGQGGTIYLPVIADGLHQTVEVGWFETKGIPLDVKNDATAKFGGYLGHPVGACFVSSGRHHDLGVECLGDLFYFAAVGSDDELVDLARPGDIAMDIIQERSSF